MMQDLSTDTKRLQHMNLPSLPKEVPRIQAPLQPLGPTTKASDGPLLLTTCVANAVPSLRVAYRGLGAAQLDPPVRPIGQEEENGTTCQTATRQRCAQRDGEGNCDPNDRYCHQIQRYYCWRSCS